MVRFKAPLSCFVYDVTYKLLLFKTKDNVNVFIVRRVSDGVVQLEVKNAAVDMPVYPSGVQPFDIILEPYFVVPNLHSFVLVTSTQRLQGIL